MEEQFRHTAQETPVLPQPLGTGTPAHQWGSTGATFVPQQWTAMFAFLSGLPHSGECSGAKTKQNLNPASVTALKTLSYA